jgi:uncharacterized protein (TIGR03437 family)
MRTTRLTGIAVAITMMAAVPAQKLAGQNLIVNGSFEQGPNPGAFRNIPQGSTVITGWTVSVGNIDYVGGLWTAEDGSRSIDLEGSGGTCVLYTNCPGGIAQSFPTVAGQQYTVTFYLAGNVFGDPVVKTILFSAAGQSQSYTFDTTGFSAGNMGWAQIIWNFTASDTTTTLEFDSADDPPTGWGPVIDNVSVVPSTGGPTISSLVNGASFQSGIVANSLATIFGSSLTTFKDTWDSGIVDGQFPTMVDDVTVTVGGQPAYPNYISPGQINIVVPDVAPGPQDVIVTNSAGSSTAFSATVSQFGPAFFSWPNNQVVATRQDFSYAVQAGTFPSLTTVPAAPGDVIILWGVGFGPTTPTPPAGVETPSDQIYSSSTLPTVTVNNIPATVYGAALAPGFAPIYQVAIQVPTALTDGDWQVLASIGGVTSPVGMVLTVQQ